MALSTWLAFFVASWLISLWPGAGAISCMATSMRYGYVRGLWNIVGLQLGILFVISTSQGPSRHRKQMLRSAIEDSLVAARS
jgi:homoserine/homoserine lactone efflux protein